MPSLLVAESPAHPVGLHHPQDFLGPWVQGSCETRPGTREVFVPRMPESGKPTVAKSEFGWDFPYMGSRKNKGAREMVAAFPKIC